jgi:hypothetical protein
MLSISKADGFTLTCWCSTTGSIARKGFGCPLDRWKSLAIPSIATESLLHAHSIDAARQGFPKACKTARGSRKAGLDAAYPHKRKRFRTTIWKNTAIRRRGNRLELSTGKGNPKVISYHPHSGWFEEALPGRAINGEGSREAMRTHHHFGLNVQVQLLLTTIFFFLIRMQPLTFLSFSILLLTLAGSEENLLNI